MLNKDFWTQRCLVKRAFRSKNADMQEVLKLLPLLQDEPCCLYQKARQAVTPDGVVWRKQPRVSVSPDSEHLRPKVDDVFVIDGMEYSTTMVTEHTDYDGSYLGSTCDLTYVGIASVSD
jgi:hypothetical protein